MSLLVHFALTLPLLFALTVHRYEALADQALGGAIFLYKPAVSEIWTVGHVHAFGVWAAGEIRQNNNMNNSVFLI